MKSQTDLVVLIFIKSRSIKHISMNSKKRKAISPSDGILFSLVTNYSAQNWVTVSVLLSSVDCLVFAKIIMRQVFMSRKKCGHIAWEIVNKLASTMVLRGAFCIPIFFARGYLSLMAWRFFLFTTPAKEFMNISTVLSCYYLTVLVKIRKKFVNIITHENLKSTWLLSEYHHQWEVERAMQEINWLIISLVHRWLTDWLGSEQALSQQWWWLNITSRLYINAQFIKKTNQPTEKLFTLLYCTLTFLELRVIKWQF